jgi:uncharacterized protein YegJ (DUF2314 family)
MRSRALLVVLCCLVACQRSDVVRRAGEPDVVKMSGDDPEMNAAIASAQKSVRPFIDRLQHPSATQSYAAIKMRLIEGPVVEHVWLDHLAFDGTRFHGMLGNAPTDVRRVKLGDSLTVARDSISDWMLVDRDTVYGSYTTYVLRDHLSPSERRSFNRDQGMYFGVQPRSLSKSPNDR